MKTMKNEKMMRQGTKANRSGKTAENEVQTILESNGYPFFKYKVSW